MKILETKASLFLLCLLIFLCPCKRQSQDRQIPDIDGLERRPSPRFAIMSVDPHMAEPGQAVEIYGGEILAANSEIRIVFTERHGKETMVVPDRSDEFEINFTVPDNVPQGLSYITLLQPDQSGMVESINNTWFFVPSKGETVQIIGLTKMGEAEVVYGGFLRGSGQNSSRFQFVLENNRKVDIKVEALKIEGYDFETRYDGYPDLALQIEKWGGSSGIYNDDISDSNLNAALSDLKLEVGKYILEVKVPRNYQEKSAYYGSGKKGDITMGIFRLEINRKGPYIGESSFEELYRKERERKDSQESSHQRAYPASPPR